MILYITLIVFNIIFCRSKNMEIKNIKLNENLLNKFFGGMDSECLAQVQHLVEQGAVLNTITGELVLNNIRTGIFTDYLERC